MLPNYPPPSIPAFNWTGQASLNAGTTTGNVKLPSTPANDPANTTVIVTNLGTTTAFVNLGGSSVTVTAANGYPCPPNVPVALALNGATYLAGIVASGTTALALSVGR